MAKRKKNEVKIEFIGNNATSVTGSCTLVSFNDRKILIECGGIQDGKTIYDNYKLNKTMMRKIRAKEIDTVILCHNHYDHQGNVPELIKRNPNIKIIAPKYSTSILKEMWLDSAGISERDCIYLSEKYSDKVFEPIYGYGDVEQAVNNIVEYDNNDTYKIDDELSIRYIPSGHIFAGQQCYLYITLNNHVYKILVTSDLGNLKIQNLKPFVDKFEPMVSGNIAICECTYGSSENIKVNKKIVNKDLEKIKTVIEQFCVENHRRVLLPVFSLDKCPNMLWLIYQMFKDYPNFDTKIVVDSPLTNRLLDRYSEVLQGEAKDKFDEMLSWKNLIRITEAVESKEAIKNMTNCVILSSGGMLQSGRSVRWMAELLPHSDDCVIFNGYCGIDTLGWKIKHSDNQKTITINGKAIKNKCQIVVINSMSSHMQRDDLLNYYKGLNVEKICLVHGDFDGKVEFAEDLKKAIQQCDKTTKVVTVNKGTTINL